MGIRIHGHNKKRDVDAEKHLKRLHKTVPFIESPLQGADHDNLVFSQRHEANTVELFFDLFFAANLATFTTYHSVTDTTYLLGYIGFFGILWSCWFQVTLHDVRFARDSMYERICKTIQYIVFVGLALVGSGFNPGGSSADNTNFRILCYTLVLSRALFVVQYFVVLFYTARARYSKLYLPLSLMILTYFVAAIGFGAMTAAFPGEQQPHMGIYSIWYVIMTLESVVVIGISSYWRMLSFKKTHLMERMSLLTLIVIGEGAIGVTKTVSRLMGKEGLDVEGCFLIICIIIILVLLWALYFDNFPHGHYGTIRQQIWSLLHFPFQLSIVGVVEGSQQVALARYVSKNHDYMVRTITQYCYTENLNGAVLRDRLMVLANYWDFESKIETLGFTDRVAQYVYTLGNSTNICSPANITTYLNTNTHPIAIENLTYEMFDGVYRGLGMKIPTDKLTTMTAQSIAMTSWRTVYMYYWSSFIMLISCSIIFLFLIRRHRVDVFDFVSIISRFVALAIGITLLALIASADMLYNYITSPGVLPTCLSLLFLVSFLDKIGASFSNWKLKQSGEPYALEYDEHHSHHHSESHGSPHLHDDREPLVGFVPDHRKSAASWSMQSGTDREPLTSEAYQPPESYAMGPVMSPPLPAQTPPTGHMSGGYMPVHGQHYGV